MKRNESEILRYSNDRLYYQVKDNLKTIGTYVFMLILWVVTVSFQTSLYTFMNLCCLIMTIITAIGVIKAKEDREAIFKQFKKVFILYLITIFFYDLLVKVALVDKINAVTNPDAALITLGNFLTHISTIAKFGTAAGYLVWVVQKCGIFNNNKTKRQQIEELRNYRENTPQKKEDRFDYNDRM